MSALADNSREMFQSEIVRRTGLSRSRTSEILTSLEGRALVSRFQQGRNYSVNLNAHPRGKDTLRKKKQLRLGFTRAAEYPFVIPFRRHMRDDFGIEMEFEIYENGLDVARDLSTLRLDLGIAPILTSFMYCSLRAPFSLIAPAGSGGCCVISRKKPNDLLSSELKVATTKLSTMELLLKSSVREHFLPAESRAIYTPSPQNMMMGLRSKRFDAACIWEPYATILARKYGMSKVVNYRDIGAHVCCALSAGNHISDPMLRRISSRFEQSVIEYAENPDSYLVQYSSLAGFEPKIIREVSSEYSYPTELDANLISKQFERAGILTPIPSTVKDMIRRVT
ncbi:MAG: helix-turn-helix domain-containing protein [Nitrososphaerota archaeon]|nr:helix-turn-helix domain-containing protein [Nitrososphaerota archaeon]